LPRHEAKLNWPNEPLGKLRLFIGTPRPDRRARIAQIANDHLVPRLHRQAGEPATDQAALMNPIFMRFPFAALRSDLAIIV
jgi:hypothetical protein